jgi:hypothetical protein
VVDALRISKGFEIPVMVELVEPINCLHFAGDETKSSKYSI